MNIAKKVAVAVALVLLGILLRVWPLQGMGTYVPYVTFFPAVTIAAIYGGSVSGVVATLLSSLYVYYWQYTSAPDFKSSVQLEGLFLFAFTGILIAIVSEMAFRTRTRAEHALEVAKHELQLADAMKQAQSKVSESEDRFRNLFENSPTGMVAVEPESQRFVLANRNAQKMYGYSEAELQGKSVYEVTHPEDMEVSKSRNAKLVNGEVDNLLIEKRYLKKDGDFFWAQSSISALRDAEGKVDLLIGSFIDITGFKQTEEKIGAYVKQLEGSMHGTLQAVSKMVEQRDPYTSGHERRVGQIAADIAREMGFDEDKCKSLQLLGLVHDIGKIGIPAEILTKPSKLTALEYEMVKTHAERGYEILKDVDFPLPIAEIIRQHHERLDGSGYPQGLKGEDILLEARVIAVADVLESMASHRPYRPSLGVELAIRELEDHRHRWFDADVVDTLLKLIREKGYQVPV